MSSAQIASSKTPNSQKIRNAPLSEPRERSSRVRAQSSRSSGLSIPPRINMASNSVKVPQRVSSPVDETNIVIEGRVVDRSEIPDIEIPKTSIDADDVIRPAPPTESFSEENGESDSSVKRVSVDTVLSDAFREVLGNAPQAIPQAIPHSDRNTQQEKVATHPHVSSGETATAHNTPPSPVTSYNTNEEKGIQRQNNRRDLLTTIVRSDIPDYSLMTPIEREQIRARFRTKYGSLRDAWPNYHIPDFPETKPLEEIHSQYNEYVRHIHINNHSDSYRFYLVVMWLVIELAFVKMGINQAVGYTKAQMGMIGKYDTLLVELGESKYITTGGSSSSFFNDEWPVEWKLVGVSLVNALMFLAVKFLAGYIGEGMADGIIQQLVGFFTGGAPTNGQPLFGSSNPGPQSIAGNGNIAEAAIPTRSSPQGMLGGLDITSLLSSFGSMFISNQANRNNQPPRNNNPVNTSGNNPAANNRPGTPNSFNPVYNE